MKPTLLLLLHNKAIQILEAIAEAERRAQMAKEEAGREIYASIDRKWHTHYMNRYKINMEVANRLTQSYERIMNRINTAACPT